MKIIIAIVLTALLQLSSALPSNPNKPSFAFEPFILNGQEAKVGELPHQLMMERKKNTTWSFTCGSILVNKWQAITAAHCVDTSTPDSIRLVAGLHDRSKRNGSQTLNVKKIVVHPTWNQGAATFSDDIAIITFTTAVKFNKNVQPVVWNKNDSDTFAFEKCIISGWGKRQDNQVSATLQKANINVITNNACQDKTSATIYGGHVCVWELNYGACSGDSGGPLTCERNGKHIVVGIASWVHMLLKCNPRLPSVYARVSYFKDFIEENLIE